MKPETPAFLLPADADEVPASSIVPAVSVCEASSTSIAEVGQDRLSYIEDASLQDILAYAATRPLLVRDLACGEAHPDLPGVTRVPLSNRENLYALIDSDDYPLVRRYAWRMQEGSGYAFASDQKGSKKAQAVFMHRLILMVGPSARVDHKNGLTLDNRKTNLRPCSAAENCWNSVRPSHNTSGVKGVSWHSGKLRWQCVVRRNGVLHRKEFKEFEDAVAWVTAKRELLHGEFACHGARDPADTFDYFQAQGIAASARLKEGAA